MQPLSPEQVNEAVGSADSPSGTPFISDRFKLDQIKSEPTANYTFAGVCAIIAFILFVVAFIFIYQDFQFLQNA